MVRDGPIPGLIKVNEIEEVRIGRLIKYVREVVNTTCRSVLKRVPIHSRRKDVDAGKNADVGARPFLAAIWSAGAKVKVVAAELESPERNGV
jgi:hypothetical protein